MAFDGAKGVEAELRIGGRSAARLRNWSLTGDPESGFVIVAELAERTAYFDAHGQLEARLQVGQRVWRWRQARAGDDSVELELLDAQRVRITTRGKPEVL